MDLEEIEYFYNERLGIIGQDYSDTLAIPQARKETHDFFKDRYKAHEIVYALYKIKWAE